MFVSVSRSAFEDNRATGIYGGAVFVASTDSLSVSDSRFRGNVATKGGAARVRNDLREAGTALGNVSFAACSFDDNVAQFGGGIHVDGGGSVAVIGTNFTGNAASAAGAGVAVGDGGELRAAGARFSRNGNSSCVSPPATGGALAVGIDDFKPYAGCSAPATVPPSAAVSRSLFEGNVAAAAGGAVAVRSGTLSLSDSEVRGNAVTGSAASKLPLGASSIALRELAVAGAVLAGGAPPGPPTSPSFAEAFGGVALPDAELSSPPAGNPRARGGGVFVGGPCGASVACTGARAALRNVTLLGNSAAEAGGGVFYDGTGSAGSSLSVSGGAVRANRAPEGSAGGGGVGGGLALVGRGFSLDGAAVSANAARFGGGLFVSADLSPATAAAAVEGGAEGRRSVSLSSVSFGAATAATAPATASAEGADSSVLDGNAGARGRDVFWLRAASPAAALDCAGCSFFDAEAAPAPAPAAPAPAPPTVASSASSSSLALVPRPPGGAFATEAIAAALEGASPSSSSSSSSSSSPFASVQSGSSAPAFLGLLRLPARLLRPGVYNRRRRLLRGRSGGGGRPRGRSGGGGGGQGPPPGRRPPRRRRRGARALRPLGHHGRDRLRGAPAGRVRPVPGRGKAGAAEQGARGGGDGRRRRGELALIVVVARRRPGVAARAAAHALRQRVRPRDAGP